MIGISVDVRHHDVKQDEVRCALGNLFQRLAAGIGALGLVSEQVQFLLEIVDVEGLVINDEDA
jgi:hypothetical protein